MVNVFTPYCAAQEQVITGTCCCYCLILLETHANSLVFPARVYRASHVAVYGVLCAVCCVLCAVCCVRCDVWYENMPFAFCSLYVVWAVLGCTAGLLRTTWSGTCAFPTLTPLYVNRVSRSLHVCVRAQALRRRRCRKARCWLVATMLPMMDTHMVHHSPRPTFWANYHVGCQARGGAPLNPAHNTVVSPIASLHLHVCVCVCVCV